MKITTAKINISENQKSTVLICIVFLFHTVCFQYSPCFSSAKINVVSFKNLRPEELVCRSLYLEQVLKTQGQNHNAILLRVAHEIMKLAIPLRKDVSRKNWKSDIFSLVYVEYPHKSKLLTVPHIVLPFQEYTLKPIKNLPVRLRKQMTVTLFLLTCVNMAFKNLCHHETKLLQPQQHPCQYLTISTVRMVSGKSI